MIHYKRLASTGEEKYGLDQERDNERDGGRDLFDTFHLLKEMFAAPIFAPRV